MSRYSLAATSAALLILSSGVWASADQLRCKSVNGNLNCAGSGGASCQTVNGKTVCVSGSGDVVQSFGNGASPDMPEDEDAAQYNGNEKAVPSVKQRLQQLGPSGHRLLLEQDATKLHLRTDWLAIDRK